MSLPNTEDCLSRAHALLTSESNEPRGDLATRALAWTMLGNMAAAGPKVAAAEAVAAAAADFLTNPGDETFQALAVTVELWKRA